MSNSRCIAVETQMRADAKTLQILASSQGSPMINSSNMDLWSVRALRNGLQVPITPACDVLTAACAPTVCATAEVALALVAGLGTGCNQCVLVHAAAGRPPLPILSELKFQELAFDALDTSPLQVQD